MAPEAPRAAASWRLIDTAPAPGAWNMAMDQALMDSVRGGASPVLRFYRWSPPCLSLGRNQPALGEYDLTALARAGIAVVRRLTGGRAVLHRRELTYSVVMPDGLLGPPREAYAAINRGLLAGLHSLGVPAELQPYTGVRAPAPSLAPCFRDPAPGEVVLHGRKLIGSAQVREGGVTLQHGSLLLADDQASLPRMLIAPGEQADAPAVLESVLAPLPSWETLTRALAEGFEGVVGSGVGWAAPSEKEATDAGGLSAKYSDPAWTWRR